MGAAEKESSDGEAGEAKLINALTSLTDEMRASRDSVQRLERTVERFVVAAERQLASGEAVQRRAAKELRGWDQQKIAEMNRMLDKKLGKLER